MKLLLWIVLAAAGLWFVDRALLWAEARGWIYWRKKKPKFGGGGDAVLGLVAFINPSATHIAEAKEAKKVEERDSGDGPRPGDEPPA